MSLAYRVVQPLIWCTGHALFRMQVRGVEHVPRTGGAFIAANHASYLDPFWVGGGLPVRPVSIMSTTVVGRIPLLGAFVRSLHALTILKRTGFNKDALREFVRVTRDEGRLLLIFPEGTRTADGEMHAAQRGLSLLARMAGVPVIPTLLTGTRAVWPKGRLWPTPWGRVSITFGPPIRYEDAVAGPGEEADAAFSRVLMERIAALHASADPVVPFRAGLRTILTN